MPIIEVNHVTKEYQLGHITSFKENIANAYRRMAGKPLHKREDFKALDDVSFSIEQGEVVGIIGHNGAGKSTLLKHLANISKPTKGNIIVRGSVAPLIEVGAGVNPELTGRENIFLNGAILGIPKKIILQKLDEIIEFSELEQFIDTPVKRYSSGMTVKLGFSIATSLDADILIIDEVLAVGDLAFQRKCFDRMEEQIHNKNKTVIIVGHNIRQIERISTRIILMQEGKIVLDDAPKPVANLYYTIMNDKILDQRINIINEGVISSDLNENAETSGIVEILELDFSQNGRKNIESLLMHNKLTIGLIIKSKEDFKNADVAIGFHTKDIIYIATFNISRTQKLNIKKGTQSIKCEIDDLLLNPGIYGIRIGIVDQFAGCLWYKENVSVITVISGQISRTSLSLQSLIDITPEWSVE